MDDRDLAAALDDARALGVGWVRLDLDWSEVQPDNASSYQWAHFDRVVSAARSRGLSLMPVVAYTPSWARPAGATSNKWAPADPKEFASFAAAAVRRYEVLGVHTWEIWNEPNVTGYWAPRPDPAAYVRLLSLATKAMREADPRVFVVSGGLAPSGSDGQNVPQLDFLSSMCKLGASTIVDAIGYHPYSFPVSPEDPVQWSAWAKMATTSVSVTSILAACGTPNKEIWATEYGAPTNGPGAVATAQGYDESAHPDHVDEAFQAVLAVDSVKAALRTPSLAALFWYTDRDLGTDARAPENFFGLRRFDGSAKPAYDSLRRAIAEAEVSSLGS